jgi:hypothetical protein
MIEQTYKSLSDLKELYREEQQDRHKRAYDQKKLERKLSRQLKPRN